MTDQTQNQANKRQAAHQQKDQQLRAFAAHLRDERLKQGRSLHRVAKALAMTREKLTALETWDETHLPAEAFRVGQLNAYANILGVEPISPKSHITTSILSLNGDRDIKVLSRWLVGGALALMSLVLVGYLTWISRSLFLNPQLALEQPEIAVVTNERVTISGQTDQQTIVRVDGQPVGVDEAGKFSTEVGIRDGQNDVTVTAINSLGHQTTKVRSFYKQ